MALSRIQTGTGRMKVVITVRKTDRFALRLTAARAATARAPALLSRFRDLIAGMKLSMGTKVVITVRKTDRFARLRMEVHASTVLLHAHRLRFRVHIAVMELSMATSSATTAI